MGQLIPDQTKEQMSHDQCYLWIIGQDKDGHRIPNRNDNSSSDDGEDLALRPFCLQLLPLAVRGPQQCLGGVDPQGCRRNHTGIQSPGKGSVPNLYGPLGAIRGSIGDYRGLLQSNTSNEPRLGGWISSRWPTKILIDPHRPVVPMGLLAALSCLGGEALNGFWSRIQTQAHYHMPQMYCKTTWVILLAYTVWPLQGLQGWTVGAVSNE